MKFFLALPISLYLKCHLEFFSDMVCDQKLSVFFKLEHILKCAMDLTMTKECNRRTSCLKCQPAMLPVQEVPGYCIIADGDRRRKVKFGKHGLAFHHASTQYQSTWFVVTRIINLDNEASQLARLS